ncbi:MAG: DUF4301 domain-containing protein [Marinilabiliales bacterium]|nr:MAG: DUF4301 domain-containing protein [Marinilabiliales bacterium]
MFSEKDILQIKGKGLEVKEIDHQIDNFKKGFPFIKLISAATPQKGIECFTETEINDLVKYFDENVSEYELIKFVPASGAASRMFKHLFEFMTSFNGTQEEIMKMEKDKGFNSVYNFFHSIKNFAFYNQLKDILSNDNLDLDKLIEGHDYKTVLEYFLTEKGLNYANLPKGLLQFHFYNDGSRLAVEEHLVEAAVYSTNSQKISSLHLTVSPDHESKFKEAIESKKSKFENKFGVKFKIDFSQQSPQTDMIAVDMENNPFRKDDGELLFRPGGHGALIENLNKLEEEIVFIKNIDNIVPDRLRDTTYTYKKAIGGLLMKLQEKCFEFLDLLESGNIEDQELDNIKHFAEHELFIDIPNAYRGFEKMERIDFLYNKLNRPIRICGMVKNEGEPGGGPFWVENSKGEISLQIVESSQMNLNDESQKTIVSNATHFNPVDLVCSLKDFNGNKFDLKKFVDPETGFISTKSLGGKELKAQELPGLWNGAMADWISIFVETPIITFNPVKTVNDLLRPQHQAK